MQKSALHNNLHWKWKIHGVLLTSVVIFVPVQKIFTLCFLVLLISVNDQCWNVLLSEVLPITWHFSNIVFKQDLNVKWLCCVLHDNRLTSVIVNSSIHSDTTVTFLTQIKCYIHIYLSIYIYTHITFNFIHELSHFWFLIFSAIFLTIFFFALVTRLLWECSFLCYFTFV